MLRPTASLTFVLGGTDATAQTASSIKRSYVYIAPVKIVADRVADDQADKDGEAGPNRIELEVRLPGHPYLCKGDPAQDEVWEKTVLPWLVAKVDKTMGTVLECNNESRRSFSGVVDYAAITLVLEGLKVTFNLEADDGLRDIKLPLERLREAVGTGMLDLEHVREVFIPADAARAEHDWIDIACEDGTTQRIDVS